MLKWLVNWYHGLFAPTTGDHIGGIITRAEASYRANLETVEKVYAKERAVAVSIAHKELDLLEGVIERARARTHALLASEVDMGERNVDAAMLHLNLTKAAGL